MCTQFVTSKIHCAVPIINCLRIAWEQHWPPDQTLLESLWLVWMEWSFGLLIRPVISCQNVPGLKVIITTRCRKIKYYVAYFIGPKNEKMNYICCWLLYSFGTGPFMFQYCCWKESRMAHSVLRLEFAISFCTGKEQLQVRRSLLYPWCKRFPWFVVGGLWWVSVAVTGWPSWWSAKNFICLISVDFMSAPEGFTQ